MIKNGRPLTLQGCCDRDFSDKSVDDHLITDRPEEEQKKVFAWIDAVIMPRKYANYDYSSYTLKHLFHHDTGIYLYSNEFKDAMLLRGYDPVDPDELNWHFRIKVERSRL